MLQDICSDCYETGYDDGRRNAIIEVTETIRAELLRCVLKSDVIYVSDVSNILDEVKRVLCEESDINKSD